MKLPISLVVITYNEERHIARCLQSAPFASEIIVGDSFSTDGTVTITKGLGARVEQREFQGYRAQKQWVTDLATQPWVLSLDADEFLSPRLIEEIISLFQNSEGKPPHDAYRMPRCSFHLGRWIRHGGWYPDHQTRLFKKGKAHWIGEKLHEKVEVVGTFGDFKNDLKHFVFSDLAEQVETNNRFSTLGAQEYLQHGTKFSVAKLICRPIGKFIECYFIKCGFLDGLPGFIIAVGAAYSLFLRYAKLWESKLKS